MSEQNPSAAPVPEVPSAPQPGTTKESMGNAPATETAAAAPAVAPAPRESIGDAPAPRETIGDAPAPRESIGDAPAPRESIGDAAPVQSTGEAPAPVATVGAEPAPLATVGGEPAPAETEVAPTRKRSAAGRGLLIMIGVVVLILIAAGGYYFLVFRTSPARAGVGDCLSGSENPSEVKSIKLVDCGDSTASFRVTKKVDNQPQKANDNVCDGADHDDIYWYGSEGELGTVLCLLKLNP